MKFNNYVALKVWGIFMLAGLIFLGSSAALAQDKPKVSGDEAKAAKKIEEAKGVANKVKAAEEFVNKYPNSPIRRQAAEYLASQIGSLTDHKQRVEQFETYFAIFFQDEEMALVMPMLIDSYVKLQQHKDAFNLADKYLTIQPDDVTVRLQLAVEGSNMARTGSGAEFLPRSRDYAVKAIELIEADKKPAQMADAQWSEYRTRWLPQLYQSLGFVFVSLNNRAEARAKFEKATTLAPAEVNNWAMLAFMLNDEYQEMAKRYNVTPQGKERDDLLSRINEHLDKVIEAYARVVAMTDSDPNAKPINTQFRQDLESYYKFRNNNSTEGLKKLIDKYKSAQ